MPVNSKRLVLLSIWLFLSLKLTAQQDSILNSDLDQITINSSEFSKVAKKIQASVLSFNQEDVLKLPATFNDPARLAESFSGVANTNDQANGLSIRGNNPDFFKWNLEGIEIVNPNHLSNAGTSSDRPSQSSGGVNIFSAQLLNSSELYKGSIPPSYNNAVGGILDMTLKTNNTGKHNQYLQAGLIGMEASLTGPINKTNKAAYGLNYRYSTVGLLSSFGIDFGGETISFQDLLISTGIKTEKGFLKLFALSGLSKNDFVTSRNTEEWEIEKDQFDIRFKNLVNILGASMSAAINEVTSYKTSIIYSGLNYQRESDFINDQLQVQELVEQDKNQTDRIGIQFKGIFNFKSLHKAELGIRSSFTRFDIDHKEPRIPFNFAGQDQYFENSFFAQFTIVTDFFHSTTGMSYKHVSFQNIDNSESVLEPRFKIILFPKEQQRYVLGGGFNSQINPHEVYISESISSKDEKLAQTKSVNINLTAIREQGAGKSISLNLYVQRLMDVPVATDFDNFYSLINGYEEFRYLQKTNEGEGLNYGVEMSLDKRRIYKFYYLLNASFYESKFRNSEEEQWRDTRFNGNYIFNCTLGQVWNKEVQAKKNASMERSIGANIHVRYVGGFRDSPIDINKSELNGTTVYEADKLFSLKQKDYFRIDLSIFVEKVKAKYSSRLSLDIQNLLNRRNIAFSYYDTFTNDIRIQNQLGLIPVLNYRISI